MGSGELMATSLCGMNLKELVEDQDIEERVEQVVLELFRNDKSFASSDSTDLVFFEIFLKSS